MGRNVKPTTGSTNGTTEAQSLVLLIALLWLF